MVENGTSTKLVVAADGGPYEAASDYAVGRWTGWAAITANSFGTRITKVAAAMTGNVLHVYALGANGRLYTVDGDYDRGPRTGSPPARGPRRAPTRSAGSAPRIRSTVLECDRSAPRSARTGGGRRGWRTQILRAPRWGEARDHIWRGERGRSTFSPAYPTCLRPGS
ncbi:hypothetical protein [Streptomyces sp. BE303]|uniref:hypothetical protein n=1 Tax=Streptomyces sp. BE303 TaxID=3002528 RepID=UPI002E7940EA|nr:hypothetical protein [Streptomyces sp. BE303]MED7949573.1 hypothetical protein [Streptomyces sp. BE303]